MPGLVVAVGLAILFPSRGLLLGRIFPGLEGFQCLLAQFLGFLPGSLTGFVGFTLSF